MKLRCLPLLGALLLSGALGCASATLPQPDGGGDAARTEASADASPDAPPPQQPTPACEQVRASCGASPSMVVRGHAEGLTGLDGARAWFAVRYNNLGPSQGQPPGVAVGRTVVSGGAFETCVCIPYGANAYPALGAVVFRPGSAAETSAEVARALFSQRYATLGDEDLAWELNADPSLVQREMALASMDARSVEVTLRDVDAVVPGRTAWAGLVATERPVASQLTRQTRAGSTVALSLTMPGRRWPGERFAVLFDGNNDNRCGDGDTGAWLTYDGNAELTLQGATMLSGPALAPLCAALLVEQPRY